MNSDINNYYNEDQEISTDMENEYILNSSKISYQTKFTHLQDILYFYRDYDNSNTTAKLTNSWQQQRQLRITTSAKQYVCLGTRDGFFFHCKFRTHPTRANYDNYKIKIPWINIAFIACIENSQHQVKIGIKLCDKPLVEQCFEEKIPDDPANNRERTTRKQWKTIPPSSYPESIKKFCKKPKIIFRFDNHKYKLLNIKKAIYHHSKILPHQRSKTYKHFHDEISYKYNEKEKQESQTKYRSACAPCLQNHQTAYETIIKELGFKFDASKGRKCAVCKKYVGYLEEHPICLASGHSVDSCDNNIVKAIWRSKFKSDNVWTTNKIG